MSDRIGSVWKLARTCALTLSAMIFLIISGCEQSPSGPSQVLQVKGMAITVTGEFRTTGSTVGIKFNDAQGRPIDVGKVTLALRMDMPGMPMLASGEVSGSNGTYMAKVKPAMKGTWMVTLSYDGPQGSGQTVFETNFQ